MLAARLFLFWQVATPQGDLHPGGLLRVGGLSLGISGPGGAYTAGSTRHLGNLY